MLLRNKRILPQFARTADCGEKHAFQIEIRKGSSDPYAVEHKVDYWDR